MIPDLVRFVEMISHGDKTPVPSHPFVRVLAAFGILITVYCIAEIFNIGSRVGTMPPVPMP